MTFQEINFHTTFTAIVPFLRKKHATTLEEFFSVQDSHGFSVSQGPSHAPSQDTVRSQEIPVRYIDEPAAPKASKRKSMLEDSDIDEAPDEEKEEEPSQQMSTWEATPAFSLRQICCVKDRLSWKEWDFCCQGRL